MSAAAPGIIVKRDAADLAAWLSTEAGFLTALGQFDGRPIELEAYQRNFLDFRLPNGLAPRFRWVSKARQIGFSWIVAAEALCRAHLRDRYTGIFVSYNLEDAKEKIHVARTIHENLPLGFQKRVVTDSKTELAFEAQQRRRGDVSRIISNPSRAPRGKHGDIYLDELAHYVADREVYKGSTALTLRSGGQLTGCSTPLGRRGVFWEVAKQELRAYKHHKRFEIPWWMCSFFCTDVWTAAREAPLMLTADRVEKFGTEGIKEQFDSLPIEDFQQEFECSFVDESYAYFPYDLILPCTYDDLAVAEDPSDMVKPKGRLVAGVDVGRTRDLTVVSVFEDVRGELVCRYMKLFDKVRFAEQEAQIRALLNAVPIVRMRIDQTGIGRNLAENLAADFPDVVIPETFSNESKERWATAFKIHLQQRRIRIARRRDIVSQIHSIRKRVTPAGRVAFDAERTRDGHADIFWSMALAVAPEQQADEGGHEVNVRVLG